MITDETKTLGIIAAIVANGIVQDKKYMTAIVDNSDEEDRRVGKIIAVVAVDIAHHIVENAKRWES